MYRFKNITLLLGRYPNYDSDIQFSSMSGAKLFNLFSLKKHF